MRKQAFLGALLSFWLFVLLFLDLCAAAIFFQLGRERWLALSPNLAFLVAIALVASVSGPPWEHKLLGMPASANTPFMDSVWVWNIGDPKESSSS